METIKPNTLLKFNDNQLQEVRKAVGYEDVSKLKQDIELLDDWIKKQSHFKVKEFDPEYLERLLICNKGSIERTKQKFDKLCTCTTMMPEFLQNFNLENEFQSVLNVLNIWVNPIPTKDNYRVIALDLTGQDDDEFTYLQIYRYIVVITQYMMYNDYCLGFEWIVDPRKLTAGLLGKSNIMVIKRGVSILFDAMGVRLKNQNLLIGSVFFNAVLMILKQGLTAKLKERIVIHANLDSLHEKFPKELLPKELGGDLESMKDLSEMNFKEFSSKDHIERMKFMETAGTDESYRHDYKFDEEYCGIPGSFKTLCVD